MDRILLISTDKLGDLIWTTPSIKLIKSAYPTSEIYFVASSYAADILRYNPHVDHLFSINKNTIRPKAIVSAIRLGLKIKRFAIPLAIQFNEWSPNSFITRFAGIKNVQKFNAHRSAFTGKNYHQAIRRVYFVSTVLGIEPREINTQVYYSEDDEGCMTKLLRSLGVKCPYVVIHPGSSGFQRGKKKGREWPIEKYFELVKQLVEVDDVDVVIIGSRTERNRIEKAIMDPLPLWAKDRVHNVAGQTKLTQLCPLIKGSICYIGGDSGPLHIASSTDVPIVGIFGPTDPAVSGPLRRERCIIVSKHFPCSPCSRKKRMNCDRPCLTSIQPQDVLDAYQKIRGETCVI